MAFSLTFVGTSITGFTGDLPAILDLSSAVNTSGQAITDISGNAFAGQYAITSLTLPNTLITIGANAFDNCDITGSLNIPNSVTNINTLAFVQNVNLTSVTFGSGLTSLADSAFEGCTSLGSAVFNSVPTLGGAVFFNTNLPSVFTPNDISNNETKMININNFSFIFKRTAAVANSDLEPPAYQNKTITNELVTLSSLPNNVSYAIVGRCASNNEYDVLDQQFYNIKLYDSDHLPITSFETPIAVTINGLKTTVDNLYIKTSSTIDGVYTYEENTATKDLNGSYTFTINHLTFIQGDENPEGGGAGGGGGGGGDPYITTIEGVHYKLPMIDASVRYYQGKVNGKTLTVNVALRNTDNMEMLSDNLSSFKRLESSMSPKTSKQMLQKIISPARLNFMEKIYVSYGDSHVLMDIWDRRFKVLSKVGGEIVGKAGDDATIDAYTREYKGYKHQTLTLCCGSARVHVAVYGSSIVRNGVAVEAPSMSKGNGVIVNALSQADMTLTDITSKEAVPKHNTALKKMKEIFVDAKGKRTRTIQYV